MDKSKVNSLLTKHPVQDLEKYLALNYARFKNLDISKSTFLKEVLYLNQERFQKIEEENITLNTFRKLEEAMELLIPKDDRSLNGAFFTPPIIVNRIIDEVSPRLNETCLDPSCGCGAFLLGLVDYYHNVLGKGIKETIRENIYGADILDYNVRRAKILLSIYALERDVILDQDDFNLNCIDSLRYEWDSRFDAIVGNPPYVKFQDLSEENRSFLKSWQTIEKGTYNLYFVFFELGFNLLSNTGRLGYITPNNYFTSLAGEALRTFFQANGAISRIVDFNHFKVFDAQTYTCLTFLNKEHNTNILFTKKFDESLDHFLEQSQDSTVKINALNPKKWRLLRDAEQGNIYNIETLGTKLRDLFVINVGIATLKDTLFFVKDKGKYCTATFDGEEFEIERGLTKPIFKISDFSSQTDCDSNTRRIIHPYVKLEGKIRPIPEEQLRTEFPNCYDYLKHVKEELNKRTKTVLKPYYQYGRSQGLNKTGIRLLTPTFSQLPKFLKVVEGESLYCNGYGLHYKEEFKGGLGLFDSEPIQLSQNINALKRILNSYVMHYYVSHTSVSIQGGYPCYQKNFIELFSIPSLTQNDLDWIANADSLEVEEFLIKHYQLHGVSPNLSEYISKRDGTNEEKVKSLIEDLEVSDK